jgi:hypothetical protein
MSYGDYVEQLTYLLFLKMADERTKSPYNQPSAVPAKYNWPTLLKKDGDDLFDHYRHMLESLGHEKGLLGLIFNKSRTSSRTLQSSDSLFAIEHAILFPQFQYHTPLGRYHTGSIIQTIVW